MVDDLQQLEVWDVQYLTYQKRFMTFIKVIFEFVTFLNAPKLSLSKTLHFQKK